MAVIILFIVFIHRKKQITFQEKIKVIETNYEKNILATQLEIQEQTFQHISREIHDNINLSLTLAKLHLHTLNWTDKESAVEKIESSICLLTSSIAGLSDISKGLNADIIIQHGLLKAIDDEAGHIRKAGLFSVEIEVLGTPVYMNTQSELIIFRIIQEAFNNIIKHAEATHAVLVLQYQPDEIIVSVRDNGKGFNTGLTGSNRQAGLKNMETRIKVLKGSMSAESSPGNGTLLTFKIPYE